MEVLVVGTTKSRRVRRGARGEATTVEPDERPTVSRYAAINGLIPVRDRRKLQYLSKHTRVPQSEYLREAVRDLLRKYRDVFEGSPFEDDGDVEPI